MTLVEVLGGLALLASLLTGVLLAHAGYTHQTALANRRLKAVVAADGLLLAWHRDPSSLPRSGSGRIDGDADLSWRTTPMASPQIEAMDARVIRLEVLDERSLGEPLASVEFVVDPENANLAPVATRPAASPDPSRKTKPSKPSTKSPTHAPSLHHP